MRRKICVAVATLLLSMLAAASGAATLTQPPITILSCRVENFGGYGGQVEDLLIVYKSTYASPATSVRFSVNYRGDRVSIVDKGTFAPNVKQTRRFHEFTDQNYQGKTPDSCVAVHAVFADGSTWSALTL